jgi:hypothetical protein
MKFNFFKQKTIFLSITALLGLSAAAMEKEKVQPSEYVTILNSAMPLFMRIREGEMPNISVIRSNVSESKYTIAGNQETFLFPQDTKIRIKLDSVNWPLRLRWWAAQDRPGLGIRAYLPIPDIDQEGRPIETSENNKKNSVYAFMLDEEDFQSDERYMELYINDKNEIDSRFSVIEPRKAFTQIPVIRAGYGKTKK